MRPLSDRCPKPLLPVLGKPLIEYAINQVKTLPIQTIGVNTHHGADKVESFLENGSNWGIEIIISREKEILGTGGGMRAMGMLFSNPGPFLVYNGDVLADINLHELTEYHFHRGPLVTLALYHYPPKNNVTLSPDGSIVDFLGKRATYQPGRDRILTFTGISVVDTSVLAMLPPKGASNIIDLYLDLITRKPGSILGYVAQGKHWIDIGTPSSYLEVHGNILLHGQLSSLGHASPGTGIYKGSGSVIEPGALLEGFVSLGRDCLVERGAVLRNSVIWDHTTVRMGERLEYGVQDGEWKYTICGG
jgi:NDP-sugar pyrophosphorylase family protein